MVMKAILLATTTANAPAHHDSLVGSSSVSVGPDQAGGTTRGFTL
jgi:hypothetical protein